MNRFINICKTSLISKYGMNKVLQPFIRDLNLLESVSSFMFVYWNQIIACSTWIIAASIIM